MNRYESIAVAMVSMVIFLLGFAALPVKSKGLPATPREIIIQRGLSDIESSCITCHSKEEPGKYHDWSQSIHARAGVTCIDCHRALRTDKDAMDCPGTEKWSEIKISPVVTPNDCKRCHPVEAAQFSISKHARTWEIQTDQIKDPWLKGMNCSIERATGCYVCHGSDISDGVLTAENWPNSGCGRINPDGSKGVCVICHTTHRFSISEARKPENCGQCHLGPDHPQDEIYFESKHGKRYHAESDEWNFDVAPDTWEAGSHFSAPTCAVCHMSGVGPLATTHDVGERLKWEAQAPMSIHNKDHSAEEARSDMITVCTQCHSPRWAKNYLDRLDMTMLHYNEEYFAPVTTVINALYADGVLTEWPVFDEEIEWYFYEFWHHEGRRARMGASMMGPDYAWWHGFYDLKRTYQHIMHLAETAREKSHGSPAYVPGSGGENLTPVALESLPGAWKQIKGLVGYEP
jgi:hypothetical protein